MSVASELTALQNDVNSQALIMAQIQTALEGKISGGGVIPQGWAAALTSYECEDQMIGATFNFGNVNIDTDNCMFYMWTENVDSTSKTYSRISGGAIKFDGVQKQIIFLNKTSTGVTSAVSQLNSDEFSVASVSGDIVVTVTYVNTRKFVLGETYNAIIIGKNVTEE